MAQTQANLRVMVDANILIAGSVWPRWSYEVLQHALQGDFHLVLSEYIVQQARKHIWVRFPAYSDMFDEFLGACRYGLIADPTLGILHNISIGGESSWNLILNECLRFCATMTSGSKNNSLFQEEIYERSCTTYIHC